MAASSSTSATNSFFGLDERTCSAEEGEERTLAYILHLEKELTKAKARLSVYRAQARMAERRRLSSLRGVPLPDSPEEDEVVGHREDKPEEEDEATVDTKAADEAENNPVVKATDKRERRDPEPPRPVGPDQKRRRASALPKGICLGCYQTVQRGILGYSHQYELESCTFTPARSPQRSRALERRRKGVEAREAARLQQAGEAGGLSKESD